MSSIDGTLFQAVLRLHPEATAELPAETFRRYTIGQLPKSVRWLLRHPAMLRTLADRIELFAEQDVLPGKHQQENEVASERESTGSTV